MFALFLLTDAVYAEEKLSYIVVIDGSVRNPEIVFCHLRITRVYNTPLLYGFVADLSENDLNHLIIDPVVKSITLHTKRV
jgi:hypothetical protein